MTDSYQVLTCSGFNLDIAVLLAEASQAAYSDAESIHRWARNEGFTISRIFGEQETQGFWCIIDNAVALLVFKGSPSPAEWLWGTRFFAIPHAWGRVHKGFAKGIDEAESSLQEFDEQTRNIQKIWITGHGTGGALAQMAAVRLKMKGKPLSIYTYGQPRVGSSEFAERFAIELPDCFIRFVNHRDIVTRIPVSPFRHTGLVKRILSQGIIETALEPSTDASINTLTKIIGIPSPPSVQGAETFDLSASPFLIDMDAEPLTESEFIELQGALDCITPENAGPFMGDHAITHYVQQLKAIRDQKSINFKHYLDVLDIQIA